MRVVIHIPGALQPYAQGQSRVTVESDHPTVQSAMNSIRSLFPGVYARSIDETGQVRQHVNIFVGTDNTRDLQGLATPLAEGDELFILPSVTGGCAPFDSAPPNQ